ncbi:MAG: DUF1127 domain-containing protein [Paracoccus sp. (in: a-proteobacteria)]|nr:DUF1127 domain-containing protein [Paracoccus sp. (in: a-proteobacteria)]
MAMMQLEAPRRAGILSRLGAIFQRRALQRQTREELSRLSDRELADIGILRGDIGALSRGL